MGGFSGLLDQNYPYFSVIIDQSVTMSLFTFFYLNTSAAKNASQHTQSVKKSKSVFHVVFPMKAGAHG